MEQIKLSHKLSQKLALTPQLIQAVHLLRLPLPALQEHIKKQIEENPLLQPLGLEDLSSKIKAFLSSNSERPHSIRLGSTDLYNKELLLENRQPDTDNLHDHLLHQLRMTFLSDEELAVGEHIIDSIDSNGYIEIPLSQLSNDTGFPLERVEKILFVIQTFDPPGVGGRDLRECLLIQLKVKEMERSLAHTIVKSYFKELTRKNLTVLSKKTSVSIDDVKQAIKIISSLNPKPGAIFSRDKNVTVVPDVIVTKHKNALKIKLNEKELPGLNINPNYLKLLKDQNTSQEVKQFIAERLKNAIWLTKTMEERRNNILKVINAIVKIQKQAILKNLSHIKPLTLAEVAKISGLHHSTVSRIVANKYASTPHGTVKIRDFFSGKYTLSDGSLISSKSILLKIRDIILKGNKKTPLTDKAISDILQKDGIQISRRTVAKHRKKLNIPSSFFRP